MYAPQKHDAQHVSHRAKQGATRVWDSPHLRCLKQMLWSILNLSRSHFRSHFPLSQPCALEVGKELAQEVAATLPQFSRGCVSLRWARSPGSAQVVPFCKKEDETKEARRSPGEPSLYTGTEASSWWEEGKALSWQAEDPSCSTLRLQGVLNTTFSLPRQKRQQEHNQSRLKAPCH